jgi:hypothetical protein
MVWSHSHLSLRAYPRPPLLALRGSFRLGAASLTIGVDPFAYSRVSGAIPTALTATELDSFPDGRVS